MIHDYASALGQPILERTVGGTSATPAAEWIKPIQCKPVHPGFAPSDPPAELTRADGEDGILINVARRPLASRTGPLLLIVALVLPLMIAGALTHWGFAAVGGALLALGLALLAHHEAERRLFISPTGLRLEKFGFGAWEPRWSISHGDILSLQVMPAQRDADGAFLLINTPRERVVVGAGLALPTLVWLRDYLAMVIAGKR